MTSQASKTSDGDAYREAGVDIDLSQTLLGRAKAKLAAATRPEVLGGIGGFGGLFQLDVSAVREPVLVSSVDGVGTKLMVAAMMDDHSTVGFDIVHHCINDIAVQGAAPLWFMDYLGIGALRSPLYEQVLEGLAEACRAQNVALLGGETAEMPGMYGDDYDLVGCITGVVDKACLLTGERIAPGHVAVGLASNGLHTNGYSLARKALFDSGGLTVQDTPPGLGETIGEALLKPHTCYWPAICELRKREVPLDGMAHITGGGLYDNVPRVLPQSCRCEFRKDALPVPPIFERIRRHGSVSEREMFRVFNMGIGMVWFVPEGSENAAVEAAHAAGNQAAVVGQVVAGHGDVAVQGIDA